MVEKDKRACIVTKNIQLKDYTLWNRRKYTTKRMTIKFKKITIR